MRFPPPEAPPQELMAFVDALEDECTRDTNRAAWEMNKQRWMDLYTGNHFAGAFSSVAASRLEPEQLSLRSASTVCKLVYNRIQNAILAMLAGQISNPPKVVFSARENGEPPIYYLNGFVQNPMLQQIAMQAGAQDEQTNELASIYGSDHPQVAQSAMQAGQSVPLPPELVDQVKAMIDQGKMMTAQARMAGLPSPLGIVPPEALVEITDQSTAQFTQTIFDGLWEQCGGIEATTENILNKKVLGWQPTLVETDRSKIAYGESPITLTNVEGSQVHFDPMTSSFRPPRYVIMKEPVSLEEGIAKYPEAQAVLDAKANSGTLNSRAQNGSYGGRLFDLEYTRDMCVIRTLWYRNWPYPMDPDEAVACGKVNVTSIPTGEVEQVPDMATGTTIQRPLTRQTMVSSETGDQDIMPGHPAWPTIYGIREVRDIEGEPVYDRRCKLPTIPIPNNINIPIPFSPYGYGEPDRLDGLQMAINRILSDLVTHHRYTTYPVEVRHEAVQQAIGPELSKARIQPNTGVIASQQLFQMVGGDLTKLVHYLEIPPMSADSWKLLEFLVDAIDKEANNSAVQQGEAPAGSSGQWVANLQAAANQVAQVTSQATEAWLKQVVRLIVHFITNEMTEQDVPKYTNKYPPAIIAAFKRRQKSLYLDIGVEIQSGSAAAKQGQTQALIAAKQSGTMISDPEIMSRLDVDPDDQLKQQASWQQKIRESGIMDQMAEAAAANNSVKADKQVNGQAQA